MFIKTKLLVNGAELPIAGARYQEPQGSLGGSLSVALSRTSDVGAALAGASVRFEVIAGRSNGAGGIDWSPVVLLDTGKLVGRSLVINWIEGNPGRPGDTLNFSALNPFADKWGLAPARPVTMYDPAKVDTTSLAGDARQYIRTEAGTPIVPSLEPTANLSLRQIVDRAYTSYRPSLVHISGGGGGGNVSGVDAGAGCGFSRVITNLPNFPVERVDFTLEGGWHGGAAGLVSIFEPVYFEESNSLYIIDPSRGLPVGYTPRTLPLSCVIDVVHDTEPIEIVNAIILQYLTRNPTGGVTITGYIPSPRTTFEEVTTPDDNTRLEIERSLTDWKSLETGLTDYTTEDLVTTRTYGLRAGVLTLLAEETVRTDYQFSGRLKVGHYRTMSAVYPNPNVEDAPDTYGEVYTETCRIEWRADLSSPGDSEMLRTITETEGLVLVETTEEDAPVRRTPIQDAIRGGLIKTDASQTTERKAIKCIIERLDETGYNQAQIVTTIEDRLNGTVQTPPPVQSRTGSRSTSARTGRQVRAGASIRELILDRDSITRHGQRRAATLSIGELDPAEGRRIVLARFKRLSRPRRRVSINIPGIDFTLRRGSIVRPPLRSGIDAAFIVLGRTITIRGLGTNRPEISEQLDAIELG